MMDCAICGLTLLAQQGSETFSNECPRCGRWHIVVGKLGRTLREALDGGPNTNLRRSNLSHIVRRQQGPAHSVPVPLDDLESWGLDAPLPRPADQANHLVIWVGQNQPSHSQQVSAARPALEAELGVALTPSRPGRDLDWLLNAPEILDLVEQPDRTKPQLQLRLTWKGWNRFQDLLTDEVRSNIAFMAMKFGDEELDRVFATCFRPAVQAAGFDLRVLTDGQGAGCIDDQLRVALRTSRFVIADLTHQNAGAYWEGGYAEGLGKPVIYTCRKKEWDVQKTHFDTNHLVTVIWDSAALSDAASRLTAVVRASLPKEANLVDPR